MFETRPMWLDVPNRRAYVIGGPQCVAVTGRMLYKVGRDRVVPPEYVCAGPMIDRDVYVFAPWPLALAWRVWHNRYRPVVWLIRLGVMQCEEGAYLWTARFAPLSQWKLFSEGG